jgi:hypothetical protein
VIPAEGQELPDPQARVDGDPPQRRQAVARGDGEQPAGFVQRQRAASEPLGFGEFDGNGHIAVNETLANRGIEGPSKYRAVVMNGPRRASVTIQPRLDVALRETVQPMLAQRRNDVALHDEGVVVERPRPDALSLRITKPVDPRAEEDRERLR